MWAKPCAWSKNGTLSDKHMEARQGGRTRSQQRAEQLGLRGLRWKERPWRKGYRKGVGQGYRHEQGRPFLLMVCSLE